MKALMAGLKDQVLDDKVVKSYYEIDAESYEEKRIKRNFLDRMPNSVAMLARMRSSMEQGWDHLQSEEVANGVYSMVDNTEEGHNGLNNALQWQHLYGKIDVDGDVLCIK